MIGVPCPGCGSTDSGVIDSRPYSEGIRRRRKCKRCGDRFTTHEAIGYAPDQRDVIYLSGLSRRVRIAVRILVKALSS